MKNYISSGESINLVLADTVKGGDIVVQGSLCGIAVTDGDGVNIKAVALKGVFTVPKATGVAITIGAKLYYVTADKNVTTTASGNTLIGYAFSAAATGDTEVAIGITNNM